MLSMKGHSREFSSHPSQTFSNSPSPLSTRFLAHSNGHTSHTLHLAQSWPHMGMPEKLGSNRGYKATVLWWFAAEDQSLSSLVGGVRAVLAIPSTGAKQQGKAAFSQWPG